MTLARLAFSLAKAPVNSLMEPPLAITCIAVKTIVPNLKISLSLPGAEKWSGVSQVTVILSHSLIVMVLAFATSGCFPLHAGPRLAHFAEQAPSQGQPAPSFKLLDLQGNVVALAELIGRRPIVLQLGSHSCPVYRYRRFAMEDLRRRYAGQVNFLLVYTLEAHPVGSKSPYDDEEWVTGWNRLTGVLLKQPNSYEERVSVAQMSRQTLNIRYLMLVDELDNAVWRAYGAASSPAFVIDQQGRIALRQVWVNPGELEVTLKRLLNEKTSSY